MCRLLPPEWTAGWHHVNLAWMRAPRPDQLTAELSALADVLVKRVVENYNWLYDMGYERVTRDSERVRTSGINDEVAGIVGSGHHRRLRQAISDAARFAAQAVAAMKGADAALARGFSSMEGAAVADHTPAEFHDGAPRLISKAEHAGLVKAQQRRNASGGGYGRS